MKTSEREELRKIISDSVTKLDSDIVRLKELTKPIPPDPAIGRLTRMEAINEKSVNEAALHQAELRLEKLHHAQNNIDSEEFGECQECGEEIGLKRLKTVPEAIVCMECIHTAEENA
ncbi:MAG: hypothetical protein HN509_13935 [Halobacteriovoraceae bacterium]|jgi:DnaK suppressor protein|nr:hypothetical protein [Halobacteriovoraceae bacterium]MBT5094128.1 hypothetical protein [Halobacteriovoraceae bacterium]